MLLALIAAAAAGLGTPLPVITVEAARPLALESIERAAITEHINAIDSEDVLKYLPSLNVRKRFTGDFDHAVLASRASGTGNSARSLVYADGILLSNLLGNGASFTPRWGLVSPEEIERVDVLYGPYSAAYSGNSAGAVVNYQTRMPSKQEAHAKLLVFAQPFSAYGSEATYGGKQASASLGDRSGALSWWLDLSRLDANTQPVSFANKLNSTGASGSGTPVTGHIQDRNPANKDWLILGATSQAHSVQDHAKAKLAYELSPTLRLAYTLGWWNNAAVRKSDSYLRDAAGNQVTLGNVLINGKRYELKPSDFAPVVASLDHVMQGVVLKTHGQADWNWELAASRYDYQRDLSTSDLSGSGWQTFSAKATSHGAEIGYQREAAQLRNTTAGTRFQGDTRLESLYTQDAWAFAPRWKAMFGVRLEHWQAFDGALAGHVFPSRAETSWSPKLAVSHILDDHWMLKASLGRAVRNPTAAELFQGSLVGDNIVNSDPTLRAEKSWTGEWTTEHLADYGSTRISLFHETTRDALYAQPLTATVNTVQNVGKVATQGLELAWQTQDLWQGLSLNASATYAHSIIKENRAFPASVGKWQPRVPQWRASLLAGYRVDEHWKASIGARYSGKQYSALDNSDVNANTYTGFSKFLVMDARLHYQRDAHWSAALGVDNLNNASYWAFHPYTQRSASAELRYDY